MKPDNLIRAEATVTRVLPQQRYALKLEDESLVIGYQGGRLKGWPRLQPGDRVAVEFHPSNRGTVRIVGTTED